MSSETEEGRWVSIPENYEPKVGDTIKSDCSNWPACGNCGAESVWHYQCTSGFGGHEGPSRNGKRYAKESPIASDDPIRYLCDDCVPRGCSCIDSWIDQDAPGDEWEHRDEVSTIIYVKPSSDE